MTLAQLRYAITISETKSLNEAAKTLFMSQPSLSSSLKALETELGFDIFIRTKSGVTLTDRGTEFIGYAKTVMDQYNLLEARFVSGVELKKKFSVAMQHYSFAVKAFVELVKQYGMDEYEFEVNETQTYDVIDSVKTQKSELGILYLDSFNSQVLKKILSEAGLSFIRLFDCQIYAFLYKGHPLAGCDEVTLEQLEEYPCLSFDQGSHNSFYYAEEVMSTRQLKQVIRANDRATMLNLAKGLNAYMLCSGIICEELNGDEYCAVRLKSDELMTIGYISRKEAPLSPIANKYLDEIKKEIEGAQQP